MFELGIISLSLIDGTEGFLPSMESWLLVGDSSVFPEGVKIVVGGILDVIPHLLGFYFVEEVGTNVRSDGLSLMLGMLCIVELWS